MIGTDAPRLIIPAATRNATAATHLGDIRRSHGRGHTICSFCPDYSVLKGGTGLYYRTFDRQPANGYILTSQLIYYQNGFSQSAFSLGANAGLGIKVRLWSREFFIEETLHSFDVWELNKGVYPLTIGVRF